MSNLISASKKKEFYIDSNNRVSGTSSDFSYVLNILPDEDFTHAVVLQCLIPKSYYLIQDGLNTFQLQEGASIVTLTVPVGNYSRRSFETVVQNLLNSNSPNGWTYNINYPNTAITADTGKFTYSVSGNTSQPSLIFGSSVICEQFGFPANSTQTFTAGTLVSTNVIKMQREDAIYIHSDLVQNKEGDNVLQAVFSSTDSPAYSNITYRAINIEANSKKMITSSANVYRFFLTNEAGVPLDLNGLNIVINLMVYKKNDVSSIIKAAIKYSLLKDTDVSILPDSTN